MKNKSEYELDKIQDDQDKLFDAILQEINKIWDNVNYSAKTRHELINKLLPGTFKVKLTRD